MALLSRGGLDAVRGSIGMGQGNIRNENTRSNDMFNSPYAKNSGQAPMTGKPESPYTKPAYASGGGLNQNPGGTQQGGMQNPEGFTQQQNPWTATTWMNRPPDSQGGWNPNGFNGFIGAGSNAPYSGPIGGGFQQQQQEQLAPSAPAFGQPGQATNAPNLSVPAGPTMPRFSTGTSIGNGRDDPRRFMARPQLSMQQMQQLRTPYRPQAPSDDTAYTPPIYIQPDM